MTQMFLQPNIPPLVKASSTTLTLAATFLGKPTFAPIGGQGYFVSSQLTLSTAVSGAGGLDTGSLAANTLYYVYLVLATSGLPALIASTSSSAPTAGSTWSGGYTLVGGFVSSATPDILVEFTNSQLLQRSSLTAANTYQYDGSNVQQVLPQGENHIINGGMEFSQRIGTGNQTASASYGLDRWYLRHNVTSAQISRQDVIGQGGVSRYAIRLTNVTKGAGSYISVFQPIETENVLPFVGKRVTFSFLARKNAGLSTGGMQLGIFGTTSLNDTPANLFASTPILYANVSNGSLTTTFQLFSITCTVPSTLRTIAPYFELDNTPADGGYIEVKDVTLNIGNAPAPFKRAGGTIGGELALCQRYYEKSNAVDVPAATIGAYPSYTCVSFDSNSRTQNIAYRVTKRITVIPSLYNGIINGATNWTWYTPAVASTNGGAVADMTTQGFSCSLAGDTSRSEAVGHWAADAELY